MTLKVQKSPADYNQYKRPTMLPPLTAKEEFPKRMMWALCAGVARRAGEAENIPAAGCRSCCRSNGRWQKLARNVRSFAQSCTGELVALYRLTATCST